MISVKNANREKGCFSFVYIIATRYKSTSLLKIKNGTKSWGLDSVFFTNGGAGVSVLRFLFTLKFALTFCFCAEKCLIWLDDLQNKNILQTAKNGN